MRWGFFLCMCKSSRQAEQQKRGAIKKATARLELEKEKKEKEIYNNKGTKVS